MHSCFTDVYFTVSLSTPTSVPRRQAVKFDEVITNVGDAYISNISEADYGKFIAPVSGAYQFLVTVGNSILATNNKAKIYLRVNDDWKLNLEVDDNADLGTCHLLVKLNVGDKVWVVSVTHDPNYFMGWYTSFSGHLVHAGDF